MKKIYVKWAVKKQQFIERCDIVGNASSICWKVPKVLMIVFLYPIDAYAYFDPGTGSLLIQLTVALIAGIMMFFRSIINRISVLWQKLKNYFRLSHKADYIFLSALVGMFTAVFYSSNNTDTLTISVLIANIVLMIFFSVFLIAIPIFLSRKLPAHKNIVLNGSIIAMVIYYLRFPLLDMASSTVFMLFNSEMIYTTDGVIFCVLLLVLVFAFFWIWRRSRNTIGCREIMFCLAIATVIPAYQAVTVAMTVAVVSGDRQVSLHNKVLQGVRTDFKIRSNEDLDTIGNCSSLHAPYIV